MNKIQSEQRGALPCMRCAGYGKIADSDSGEAWKHWENLPPGSDFAVKWGIVNPIACPSCGGTGTIDVPEIMHEPGYLEPDY